MSPAGFEPKPGTLRQVIQRFRPLGQDGLTLICGLISYRIVEYKSRDNTSQIDNDYMCIWTDCPTKFTFLIPM